MKTIKMVGERFSFFFFKKKKQTNKRRTRIQNKSQTIILTKKPNKYNKNHKKKYIHIYLSNIHKYLSPPPCVLQAAWGNQVRAALGRRPIQGLARFLGLVGHDPMAIGAGHQTDAAGTNFALLLQQHSVKHLGPQLSIVAHSLENPVGLQCGAEGQRAGLGLVVDIHKHQAQHLAHRRAAQLVAVALVIFEQLLRPVRVLWQANDSVKHRVMLHKVAGGHTLHIKQIRRLFKCLTQCSQQGRFPRRLLSA